MESTHRLIRGDGNRVHMIGSDVMLHEEFLEDVDAAFGEGKLMASHSHTLEYKTEYHESTSDTLHIDYRSISLCVNPCE